MQAHPDAAMTSSQIRNHARARRRAPAQGAGFAPILILSFLLSAVVILGWAWRPGFIKGIAPQPTNLFPGFTAETAMLPVHGLVVTSLRSGSPAAAQGVAVGDDIVAIDGRAVETLDQARRYLHSDARPALLLDLVHDHERRQVRLMRKADGDDGAQAAGGGG